MKNRFLFCLAGISILLTLLTGTALAAESTTVLAGESISLDVTTEDNATLLEGYLTQLLYAQDEVATVADFGSAEDVLNDAEYSIYVELKQAVSELAAGTRTSAAITLSYAPVTYTPSELGLSNFSSQEAFRYTAFYAYVADLDITKIVQCILVDCPYECYWFDKTEFNYGGSVELSASGNQILSATASNLTLYMTVAEEYRGENEYTVNAAAVQVANAAIANAQTILAQYQNCTDLEKLYGYKEAICALVSYNQEAAASDYDGGYGNPWQVIYVFDGDDTTNVVCEGYSKAFQYLCDQGLTYGTCYTVTGSNHMWNLVELCGHRYMVDVTNSDSDGLASYDLFLLEASDAYAYQDSVGYYFRVGVGASALTVKYLYDSSTISLYYGTDVLNLSYATDDYTHTYVSEVLVSPTSTTTGLTAYTCAACGSSYTEVTPAGSPFTDVQDSDTWYYTAVLWAVDNGITAGTTTTTFSPNAACTRAQAMCFLYRYVGQPEINASTTAFKDVKSTDYYYSAVLWAVENGITAGTSATTYEPNLTCSRATIVTFLYRLDNN